MLVDTHADTAAHVGDDEVEVFVAFAELTGIELGGHFLVEAVPDDAFARGVEVELGVAGDFGVLGTLVDDAGVGDVGAVKADFLGDGVADEGAEVAGVLALDTGMALLFHEVVDAVAAALAGAGEAAATHDDGNLVGAHAMAFHHVEDGGLAVVELVGDFLEFLDFLDGVRQVLGEDFGFPFIDGSLGGGGAGVDYQRVFFRTHLKI